ncbi:MAG: prolipoprotein diacylglyceryl transferase [Lachnospiraceae bacterium]
MKNELITIGNFTIHGYGLMIAIGIIVGYLLAEYRAKKLGLESRHVFPLLICGVGGGLVGAKVLFWITIIDEIIANPRIMLNIADGFVVYGGIIAGIICGFIYCKVRKIHFLPYLDLILPSVALAQGFGRIGCFLAGCCYGAETDSAFHIVFTESQFAPNNVPLIPTQLISSGLDFLNFAVLCLLAKRGIKPGKISACYLIFYSIGRFILEFFRGDIERGNVGALSTSQFISIFVAIFGVVLFMICHKRKGTVETGRN